ncbi:hypothetical protein FNW02_08150 [Komarekiella sp. 'clone 1']|uniref:Uncharacterized protein n=1 Tax=Komarekiella delphini-convector SJRDD-AB1 TaxID=2593771 RepID=A0AA40SVM6_9NOST|nr:hypothetical protein [Komarekiella delphini-convector SJRDD-AB1]
MILNFLFLLKCSLDYRKHRELDKFKAKLYIFLILYLKNKSCRKHVGRDFLKEKALVGWGRWATPRRRRSHDKDIGASLHYHKAFLYSELVF